MKTGRIIAQLRQDRGWSQSQLAKHADISHVMVGKYERGDAVPSLEVAKKIADAFDVTIDYLVGAGIGGAMDKQTLKRIEELELLEPDKKKTLFDLIDTYIRDAKTKLAYSIELK